MVIDGAHLLMLVENRIEGSVSDFWHLWARWFLQRMGLPAPEDFGERTSGDVHPAARLDTEPCRLFRVAQRFPPNTAESWAARIEWRFLTGLDGGGPAEVARFVGALRALELMPDARAGRRSKANLGKGRRTANADRAEEAAWILDQRRDSLKDAGYLPLGKRHTVKDAASHLAEHFGLEHKAVYAWLRKKRSEGKL